MVKDSISVKIFEKSVPIEIFPVKALRYTVYNYTTM